MWKWILIVVLFAACSAEQGLPNDTEPDIDAGTVEDNRTEVGTGAGVREDTESVPGGDVGSDTDTEAPTDTESESETTTGSDGDSDADADADTGADTDGDAGAGTGTDGDTGTGSDSSTGTDSDTATESDQGGAGEDAGTDTGTTDTDTETGTGTATEEEDAGADADTDADTDTDTDAGADADTDTDADADTETDTGPMDLCEDVVPDPALWCDPYTGLVWEATTPGTPGTWIAKHNRCVGLVAGLCDDWRMPSLAELETLLWASPGPGGCLWDEAVFGNLHCYWSGYWANPYAAIPPPAAPRLSFTTGETVWLNPTSYAGVVRCVRVPL